MRTDSIRVRMTVTLTLAAAVLMLLVCGGLIIYSHQLAEHNTTELLQTTIKQITADLSDSNDNERSTSPLEVIEESRSRLEANDLAFTVSDLQGHVLLKSRQAVPLTTKREGNMWRIASLRTRDCVILIGFPWSETNISLNREATILMALGLFVTVLSAVGSWWLVGRTLTPIHQLSQQVNAASVDNLNLHLIASSKDAEIVELVDTINFLLERIARAAAMRSRFYAAASHELRTPLYVLIGSLEVALNKERSREEYRDALQVADSQGKQLAVLVRDLLSLNQLDFMTTIPPCETVDLPDMLCSILLSFQDIGDRKHLRIDTDLPSDGQLEAPSTHLEMLTRNLIENAIKYTPEGGQVSVRMVHETDGVGLIITNDYPPFPRLDCNQLFEPFYRPDSSRNIHSGGNGLGLAICKSIASANHWSLLLEQTDQGICAKVMIRPGKATPLLR